VALFFVQPEDALHMHQILNLDHSYCNKHTKIACYSGVQNSLFRTGKPGVFEEKKEPVE
jgi:hypothetical protein